MNNAELADALAAANGLTKADARKAVDAVFAAITDAAAKGEEISINGFGKFKVKDTPEREGRNPRPALPSPSLRPRSSGSRRPRPSRTG